MLLHRPSEPDERERQAAVIRALKPRSDAVLAKARLALAEERLSGYRNVQLGR